MWAHVQLHKGGTSVTRCREPQHIGVYAQLQYTREGLAVTPGLNTCLVVTPCLNPCLCMGPLLPSSLSPQALTCVWWRAQVSHSFRQAAYLKLSIPSACRAGES